MTYNNELAGNKINESSFISEIIERAGERSFEESKIILEKQLSFLRQQKIRNEGRISRAKDITEINKTRGEKEISKVTEGAILYQKIEDDATIIDISDLHGNKNALVTAVNSFTDLVNHQPHTYFNFSGDIGSGQPNKIAINEILAEMQVNFPNNTIYEVGNGDRRGNSLFHGLGAEIAEKFSPELFTALSANVKKVLHRYQENQIVENADKEIQKRGWPFNVIFGAELLKAAKESGLEGLDDKELNPEFIFQIIKTAVSKDNAGYSPTLTISLLKPLREALESPTYFSEKTNRQNYQPTIEKSLQGEALKIFNYWRIQNAIYNEIPTHTFLESSNKIIMASHTGYVKGVDKLSELVHDPIKGGQAVWNKFIKREEEKGSVEKYGQFISYNPEQLAEFISKISPSKKTVIVLAGHNHKNTAEYLPTASDRSILRVETSSRFDGKKFIDARYLKINISQAGGDKSNPELGLEFIKI